MEATVYLNLKGTPKHKLVWKGEIDFVPREGDQICLKDDECSYTVRRTDLLLYDNSLCINAWVNDEQEFEEYPVLKPDQAGGRMNRRV